MVKNLPANARDTGSIPGLERSPGEGNDNPLQYSCLENPREEEPSGLKSIGLQRIRHDKQLSSHARNYNNSDNNSNTTANIFCITLCVIHRFSTTHRLSY